MGFLGGTGAPGALGTLVNLANVGLTWDQFNKAQDMQKELLAKGEDALGGMQTQYDKFFPQLNAQANQTFADAAANTAAMQRQNQSNKHSALRQWSDLTNNTVRGMNQDSARLLGDYDYRSAVMDRQYQDRVNQGLGYLEGQGEQGRRDIRESARTNAAAAEQQLARSGFGGGQFLAGVQTGRTREESAATNRLNEALAQQKLDAYTGLSGDMMKSRESSLVNRTNMDQLNTRNRQMLQTDMNKYGFDLGQDYADQGMSLLAQQGNDRAGYNQQLTNLLGSQMTANASTQQALSNFYNGQQVAMPDLSGALSGLANQFNSLGAAQAQQKEQRRASGGGFFSGGKGAAMGGLGGAAVMGIGGLMAPTGFSLPLALAVTGGAGAVGYGAGGAVSHDWGW